MKTQKELFERDKKANMIPDDVESYEQIEKMLLKKLESILNVNLLKDSGNGVYVIDSLNNFGIEVSNSDIILFYDNEHHHIMGIDYKTLDEWLNDVIGDVKLFVNRTVRFEHVYKGKSLVRIKVISLIDGKEEEVQNFATSINPLLSLYKKPTKSKVKEILFKQQ